MRPAGIRIPPLEPGSDEWLRKMSASKIAAVLGLSPWESPFSLWHKMSGAVPPEPDNDRFRRGHYLEPAIAAWFADQHEFLDVKPGACWQHGDADWFTASPDRLLYDDEFLPNPVGILELKSDADGDHEWGASGTDEIPVGYRAQVMAQLDVVGVDVAYVAVILPYLEFREYVIRYEPAEAALIRERCAEFMRSLETGERPDLDDHTATYQAARQLHPDITDEKVEVDADLAREWCDAVNGYASAKARKTAAYSRLVDAMGEARQATYLGSTIARRQAKGDGAPYLVAAKRLPDFTDKDAA